MDLVLVYPVGRRWHWRRITPQFEEVFYSPGYFPTAAAARAAAIDHNAQPYRLVISDQDMGPS